MNSMQTLYKIFFKTGLKAQVTTWKNKSTTNETFI